MFAQNARSPADESLWEIFVFQLLLNVVPGTQKLGGYYEKQ